MYVCNAFMEYVHNIIYTENMWHDQKKTFKRSEEMSHQELKASTRLQASSVWNNYYLNVVQKL